MRARTAGEDQAIHRNGPATGYPHLYSIAAHAERSAPLERPDCTKDLENPSACPTSRAWAPVLVGRGAGRCCSRSGSGGCANTDSWVEASAAQGWPAQYGDAANSGYTTTSGAAKLSLTWTRSVKGSLAAGPALSARGYLALNAQTPAGCSLMEWENDDNGRQRWCVRLFQGGGFAGPLFDGFDNLYVGQPGAFLSFPVTQWTRWRQPVIGMPTTPRFLGHGQLLVATHLGQVLVFDAHRGEVVGSPLDLVDGVDPTDATRGLGDCAPARQGCPVAAAPAYSPVTGAVVLGVWQPGAPARRPGRAEVPRGPDPAVEPRVDQRCGGRRRHRQPGAVRRRGDGVRQRPRPTAVGAARRRRQGEMVGAAGLPGADAARRSRRRD